MNTSWPDSTDVIHVEVNSSNYSIRGQDAAVTRRPLYLCLLVIPAFAIFGNLVVIIAIVKHRKLHTVTNYMILSLAVSDLIMGVATMPVAIVYLYLQEWLFGRVTCHLWHSSDVFASTASILNMCVISLDRYWAVTAPISYPRLMSKKRGAICLTFVWTCSLVVSVPVIAWWDSVDEFTQAQCLFTEDTAYLILSSLISFYIPVCIMIIVYAKIFKVIRLHSGLNSMRSDEGRRTQLRQTVTSTNLKDDPTLPMTDELYAIQPELSPLSMNQHNSSTILVKLAKAEVLRPIFFHQNSAQTKEDSKIRSAKQSLKSRVLSVNDYKQMKLKQRNEAGVARTLGLVLGLFLMCWLPFFICNMIYAVCKDCLESEAVFQAVTWLGYTNSAINPVIYALSMANLRTAFMNVLCCFCELSKQRNRHTYMQCSVREQLRIHSTWK